MEEIVNLYIDGLQIKFYDNYWQKAEKLTQVPLLVTFSGNSQTNKLNSKLTDVLTDIFVYFTSGDNL